MLKRWKRKTTVSKVSRKWVPIRRADVCKWTSRVSPRSNLRVFETIRAAELRTRCNLSVVFLGCTTYFLALIFLDNLQKEVFLVWLHPCLYHVLVLLYSRTTNRIWSYCSYCIIDFWCFLSTLHQPTFWLFRGCMAHQPAMAHVKQLLLVLCLSFETLWRVDMWQYAAWSWQSRVIRYVETFSRSVTVSVYCTWYLQIIFVCRQRRAPEKSKVVRTVVQGHRNWYQAKSPYAIFY